jgi:hypothetical protein
MLDFVPLHLSAFDRSSHLHTWMESFCSSILEQEREPRFLLMEEWFMIPFADGIFVWAPPPAIADVTVAQMVAAHLARPWTMHIFIAPTLMMNQWQKQLNKVSDLRITLPFDSDVWPEKSEIEPLTLAFTFPHLRVAPW